MVCMVSEIAQRCRSVERFEINAAVVTLHRYYAPDIEVTLRNVSTAGFCCVSLEPLVRGAEVTLRLPGYDQLLFAKVAWCRDSFVGFSFVKGFSSRSLMSIRREAASTNVGWQKIVHRVTPGS